MKKYSLLATFACLFAVNSAFGNQTINLATGLDASGNLQTTGDLLDANWTVTGGASTKQGASAGQAFTVDPTDPDWYGGWEGNGPNSSWITQDPDTSYNGNMTFTRTFNLSAGQLSGASFANLGVSIDDYGYVTLNGHTEVSGLAYFNAGALTTFSINPADLVAGTNTLQIVENNSDFYLEGARFEGTLTVNSVPEPTGFLALAPIALGLLLLRKKLT